jgi:hypothetical protein
MFRVALIPLTPFSPQGLNFVQRGFNVRGSFQERNPRERRGCAVYWTHSEAEQWLVLEILFNPLNYKIVTETGSRYQQQLFLA